jgi:hypothetical protein
MPRKPRQPAPAEQNRDVAIYSAWKAQALAALEGPTTMLEREWKRIFVRGMTPEQAAQHAATYNRPVTVGRSSKRR